MFDSKAAMQANDLADYHAYKQFNALLRAFDKFFAVTPSHTLQQ
jgi:hypothetical protein